MLSDLYGTLRLIHPHMQLQQSVIVNTSANFQDTGSFIDTQQGKLDVPRINDTIKSAESCQFFLSLFIYEDAAEHILQEVIITYLPILIRVIAGLSGCCYSLPFYFACKKTLPGTWKASTFFCVSEDCVFWYFININDISVVHQSHSSSKLPLILKPFLKWVRKYVK